MKDQAVKIKICGLTRPEDCLAVNKARPDYAGFVFAASKRQITLEQARYLISLLDPTIQPVGVFVEENDQQVEKIAKETGLRVIQLHTRPIPGRISRLRQSLSQSAAMNPLPAIWQRLAVSLERPAKEALIEAQKTIIDFKSRAFKDDLPDYWLLDSCRKGKAGGTGESFDWSFFQDFCLENPVVLAGGLGLENISPALALLSPAIVDCSSGVETNGQKDPEKIALFCTAVRNFRRCGQLEKPVV